MGKPRTYRLPDLIPDLLQEHEAARRAVRNNELRGPVTKFENLDRSLGGALPKGVTTVQGPPGVGKTAFGLQVAAGCGTPALYVSAEMTPIVLFWRLIARETETLLSKLTGGELETPQVRRLAEMTANNLPNLGILDSTLEPADKANIVEAGAALVEAANGSALLIVVDALQTWARGGGMGGFVGDYEIVTLGVHAARSVGTELGCPVLLVSHRSRAGQQQGGLHAGKGSGDIEYQAEAVLELVPEGDGKPDAAGEIDVTLRILKNRHGECGARIPLRFRGGLQRFREATGPVRSVGLGLDDYTHGRKRKS